jgi:putative ABC transport system substrate-binding protein
MRLYRSILGLIAFFIYGLPILVLGQTVSPTHKTILVSQWVHHLALDQTVEGLKDGLLQRGYKQGENLVFRLESPQGNAPLSAQIASKFVHQSPDIVVAIATPSAQSFLRYSKNNQVKLVFASITDPVQAGLFDQNNQPNGSVWGVSNFLSPEPQLALFQRIQPSLKKLGFLYNPSEANSLSLIKTLVPICNRLGIQLVLQSANKTSDMPQAAIKLLKNVDAVFISNDNTALSAIHSIIQLANKVKIPVYVSDTALVKQGALAALGPNQYALGVQTAHMIANIMENKPVHSLEYPKETQIILNENAADLLGISLTQEIKSLANFIVKRETP